MVTRDMCLIKAEVTGNQRFQKTKRLSAGLREKQITGVAAEIEMEITGVAVETSSTHWTEIERPYGIHHSDITLLHNREHTYSHIYTVIVGCANT